MKKRVLVLFAAASFVLCASVFAVETTKAAPVAKAVTAPLTAEPADRPAEAMEKETRMSATVKVTEISDTILKADRHIKENTETMEFSLEKACSDISVGDKVKVSYIIKDDKNVATKVTKALSKVKHHAKKKAMAVKDAEKAGEEPAKTVK